MKVVLNEAQLAQTLERLAAQIAGEVVPDQVCALIGIRRRGVPIAERLAKLLKEKHGLDCPMGALDITFYRDDLSHVTEQPVVGVTNIPFSVDGRRIYMIDDVLFTGRTIRAGLDALLELGRPAAVRLLALVDRGNRELPIQADFVGLSVETGPADNVRVDIKEVDGSDGIYLEA